MINIKHIITFFLIFCALNIQAQVHDVSTSKVEKKKSAKDPYNMIVAKDGSGDYTSIQEAMYAAKAFPYQRVIINLKNGVYNEKVHVYSWNTYVSLIGESKEHTIITLLKI